MNDCVWCRYAVADFDRAVELGYSKAAKRRDSLRAMLDAQTPTTPGRVSVAVLSSAELRGRVVEAYSLLVR